VSVPVFSSYQQLHDGVPIPNDCRGYAPWIVTFRLDARYMKTAEEVGIPVFFSRKTAQQDIWRRPQKKFSKEEFVTSSAVESPGNLPERDESEEKFTLPDWARVTIFSLAILSVLSVLVIIIPSALIIPPESDQQQSLVIPVEAHQDVTSVLLSGLIPADEIKIEAETIGQIPTSGTLNIPDQYASGELTIQNLTDFPIVIPEGTVFMRSGESSAAYQNLTELEIPGSFGSEVSLKIKAVQPGTAGNAPAETVTSVLAPFGVDIEITNTEQIQGGTNRLVSAPDARDRQELKSVLSEQLTAAAQERISSLMTDDDLQLCEHPELLEITQEAYSPPSGEPGTLLELELSGQYSCAIVKQENLEKLINEILTTRYRNQNQVPIIESINYQMVNSPQKTAAGSYSWDLEITWEVENQIKESRVYSEILGTKPEDAASYLQKQLDWNQAPQIQLSPSWWFRMPFLPFRIKVSK